MLVEGNNINFLGLTCQNGGVENYGHILYYHFFLYLEWRVMYICGQSRNNGDYLIILLMQ